MTAASVKGEATGRATLEIIARAQRFNKWMYEEIRPYLKVTVLEVGSGIGNISSLLLEDKFGTGLSDYDSYYVNYLTVKFTGYSNLQDVLMVDLQTPAFKKLYSSVREQFDSVFLLNVIEHLSYDSLALSNCKFMLKPGGHLILLAPLYKFLYVILIKT